MTGGNMNHGIVCWEGDQIGSRLWNMAMAKGQFVAVYTSNVFAEGGPKYWPAGFVPRDGDPLMFGDNEYARYEPEYDQPFLKLCLNVFNTWGTVVVPIESNEPDAMSILSSYKAVSTEANMRVFDSPKRYGTKRPKHAERRLRDLIQPIHLQADWAYVLGYFYPKPITIFLTKDVADIHLFETVDPDSDYFEVLERW